MESGHKHAALWGLHDHGIAKVGFVQRLAIAILISLLCPVLLWVVDYFLAPSPLMRMLAVPHRAVTRWVTYHWQVSQGRALQIELIFLWLMWGVLPAVLMWRIIPKKT